MTEGGFESPTGRGRPLGFDRLRVIDDATALFWEHGYEATTIGGLESATGLSRSSLANSFGSKRDLMLMCLDRYLDAVEQHLVLPLHDPLIDGLDSVELFLSRLEKLKRREPGCHGCLVVNAVADFGDADPEVSRQVANYQHLLIGGFNAALLRARNGGQLADAVPADAGRTLFGLAVAINVAARAHQSEGSCSQLARAARHLVSSWRTEPRPPTQNR